MPTAGKLTEAAFTRQVLQAAKLFGWRAAHFRPARTATSWRTAMSGDVGWPDLFLVRGERAIAAELKVGKRPVTNEQAAWIRALEGAGIVAYVWRPESWPEIERVLRSPAS